MATVFTLRPSADKHGKELFQAVLQANDELGDLSLSLRRTIEALEHDTWTWDDIKTLRGMYAEANRIRTALFTAAGEWAGVKSETRRELKGGAA